ncbi:ABC transporter ATP-binding protein [Streptococcus suis]|uniref:ABC transporter ATP-binding protein n=1 Tax=Streptococcus suis TaxID=1307 RepID=UPI000C19B650|nr:ATP-binding cassette domain-containing protein [Streptococcus suis]
MIKIENVNKAFRDKIVLSNISFTANEGEVTALIGPNGSGKSTLIKILLGLVSPDEGRATFDGKNYEELGEYPFRYVGSFLDSFQPNPTRTGYNHLRWIALASGIDKQRCIECLKIVGLQDAGNKKIKEYSLGMKQRLGLATAILGDPRILILDEPINGLDPDGIRWVREFLREFVKDDKIVLLTSHYMNELERTVDRIVGLSNGKIVVDGSSKNILKEYGSFEEAYFRSVTKEIR